MNAMLTRIQARFCRRAARMFRYSLTAMGLLALLSMGLASTAHAGCYCMMESMSISTNFSKFGFNPPPCSSDDGVSPILKFLHQRTVTDRVTVWSDINLISIHTVSTARLHDLNEGYDMSQLASCQCIEPPITNFYTLHAHEEEKSACYSNGNNRYMKWSRDETNGCNGSWVFDNFYGLENRREANSGSACDNSFLTAALSSDHVEAESRMENATNFIYDPYFFWAPGYPNTIQTNFCLTNYYVHAEFYDWLSFPDAGTIWAYTGYYREQQFLSIEFDSKLLYDCVKSRLPGWPTNWLAGSGEAFYLLSNRDATGNGGQMQYRLKVPDSQTNTVYTIQWEEVTKYPNSTNLTSVIKTGYVTGTGDKVNPAIGATIYVVEMPTGPCTIYETTPEIIKQASIHGNSNPPPGTGGPRGR